MAHPKKSKDILIQWDKAFRGIQAGSKLAIKKNAINFWVGRNGSGKSTAASLLLTELNKRNGVVPSHHYNK